MGNLNICKQLYDKELNPCTDLNVQKLSKEEKPQNYQLSSSYMLMSNVQYNLEVSDIFELRNKGKKRQLTVSPKNGKNRKKFSKFSKEKNFSDEFFFLMNKARLDCEILSYEVIDLAKEIKREKNSYYLLTDNGFKIDLIKGKNSFRECAVYLRDLDALLKDKYSYLDEFEEKKELIIPFPEDDSTDFMDLEYIEKCQEDLAKRIEGKYKLVKLVYQITVYDPKISFILNIIDEQSKNKNVRELLLSEDIKYIGINSKKINDDLCKVYITFAK